MAKAPAQAESEEQGKTGSDSGVAKASALVTVSLFALAISFFPVAVIVATFIYSLDPASLWRSIPSGVIKSEGLAPIHGLILPAIAGLTAFSFESFFRAGLMTLILILLAFIFCSIVALALLDDTSAAALLQIDTQSHRTFVSGQLNNYVLYLMILIGLRSRT